MAGDSRRAKEPGKFSLALDFRADAPDAIGDTAFWASADDLAVLLALLVELCGSGCEVFFNFGLITIKNVDLGVIAGKVKAGKPDG